MLIWCSRNIFLLLSVYYFCENSDAFNYHFQDSSINTTFKRTAIIRNR